MTALYSLQQDILRDAIKLPDKQQTDYVLGIIDMFRPKTTPSRYWKQQAINDIVDSWITNDPNIREMRGYSSLTPKEHIFNSYRDAIHYAMLDGAWPRDLYEYALTFEDEPDTGADRP